MEFETTPVIFQDPTFMDVMLKLEAGYKVYYIYHDVSGKAFIADMAAMNLHNILDILSHMDEECGFIIYYKFKKEEK